MEMSGEPREPVEVNFPTLIEAKQEFVPPNEGSVSEEDDHHSHLMDMNINTPASFLEEKGECVEESDENNEENEEQDIKPKIKRKRPAFRKKPKKRMLHEWIDVNIAGRGFQACDSLETFVAGFLQEAASTRQFKNAGRGLQERIKHLSFIVHLACRTDSISFPTVLSSYWREVEKDLGAGTATWGDENYWRTWEQRVLTQIYFADHLTEDGDFDPSKHVVVPKTEHDVNGNDSDDSMQNFIDDGSDDDDNASFAVRTKLPTRKRVKKEVNADGEEVEKKPRVRKFIKEGVFHCTHCGETVPIVSNQCKKSHLRLCKPRTPLDCDAEGCDFTTTHAKRLVKHKFEMHDRTICSICGMNSDNFQAFVLHMEAHKPEKCVECGKCYKNAHMLKNHMNSTHKKTADEPCHICGKVYKNVANHVRLVHEYALQNCPHCTYTTRIQTDLARHIRRTHTEATVTVCTYCAKTTKNIKRHLQQNRCDKPEERIVVSVKCERCEKTFSSKEHMKRHVKRVHDKILDVPCPHCDYKTYCNFNLRIHVTRVHEGKQLKQSCPYCLQSVISLDWHLKMYHAEKVPGWTPRLSHKVEEPTNLQYGHQQ